MVQSQKSKNDWTNLLTKAEMRLVLIVLNSVLDHIHIYTFIGYYSYQKSCILVSGHKKLLNEQIQNICAHLIYLLLVLLFSQIFN
jgi:hypothetical protein